MADLDIDGIKIGSLSGVLKASTGTVSGSATTADLPDTDNKRYVTDAQLTIIGNTSGTNTGDQNLSDYFNTATDDSDVIAEGTTRLFLTVAERAKLTATSGTNTGDQTSIVGITGTKAQFNTAVSDGNILYVGDVTQYTDALARHSMRGRVYSYTKIGFGN